MRTIPVLAVAVGLALAGCGGGDDPDNGATQPMATTGSSGSAKPDDRPAAAKERDADAARGITIATASSQFGTVLFDEDDRAIYVFDAEESATPECYGECAVAWPPVLTEGAPQAAGGADEKLLGTTRRDDGTTQVTYAGRPLYYYVDDPAGQVLCHGVAEFGGLWLVVEPGGDPVS